MIDLVRSGHSTSFRSPQSRPGSSPPEPPREAQPPLSAGRPSQESTPPVSLALQAAAALLPADGEAQMDMSRLQTLVDRIYGDMAQLTTANAADGAEGDSPTIDIAL